MDNSMGFFSPFIDPDAARAAMQQAQMQASLQIHTFNEIIDSLDADQLRAVASVFEACMRGEQVAAQFYGQIQTMLRIKFKTCQCGQDHDKDFAVPDDVSTLGGPTSPVVEVPDNAAGAVRLINTEHGQMYDFSDEEPPGEEAPKNADGFPL